MKNYITILVLSIALFVSCDDEETTTFDTENGQTLVTFATGNSNLPVVIGGMGSVDIGVNATTSSTLDRTFNVIVDSENTTVDMSNINFNPQVVIPAGQFNGVLTINGVDNTVEISPEELVLQIEDGNGAISEGALTVGVFQVCPVEETAFVGQYMITVNTPGALGCGIFGDGAVVDVASNGGLARGFTTEYIIDCGFGSFPTVFEFNLVCDTTVFSMVDTGIGCGDATINLVVSSGDMPGAYNAADDSEFTVQGTDDASSDCAAPTQTTYTFTRI